MTIEQIKELGAIIQSLGADSKQAFAWYLMFDAGKFVTAMAVLCTAICAVYKLVIRAYLWNQVEQEIMSASGVTICISRQECKQICEWIRKGRAVERGEE